MSLCGTQLQARFQKFVEPPSGLERLRAEASEPSTSDTLGRNSQHSLLKWVAGSGEKPGSGCEDKCKSFLQTAGHPSWLTATKL